MMTDTVRRILPALLLTSISAVAQPQWQEVVRGASSTAYADIDSIRRSDTTATTRILIDYRKPPFDGNNLPYLSLTMRNEYRCDTAQFRVLAINSHSGHMGLGEQPFRSTEPTEWETVSPNTIQQDLWKVACGKTVSAHRADP